MASVRLTGAISCLRRTAILQNAIRFTCVLAVTLLPTFSPNTEIRLASATKPDEIQLLSSAPAAALIEPLSGSAIAAKDPLRRLNHAPQGDKKRTVSGSAAPKAKSKSDVTIVPKIEVSAPYFWADGHTPAVVYVSLKAKNGDEMWNYEAQEELVFQLEPRNALSFLPE